MKRYINGIAAINICVAFTSEFSRNSPGFPRGSDRDCASRRRNLLTHTVPVRAALIMCKILPSLVTATQHQVRRLRQKSRRSARLIDCDSRCTITVVDIKPNKKKLACIYTGTKSAVAAQKLVWRRLRGPIWNIARSKREILYWYGNNSTGIAIKALRIAEIKLNAWPQVGK